MEGVLFENWMRGGMGEKKIGIYHLTYSLESETPSIRKQCERFSVEYAVWGEGGRD